MCSDPPSPDPLIGEAAKMNAEIAKEALAFYKDIYTTELLPMQKEQQQLGRTLVERFLSSMDKQSEFADKQNAYYESTFKPVEERMVSDAMNYDSQENIDRRMGIAAANVEQQYSQAQQETARNLSRYGLNPNSSSFARINQNLARDGALQKAGAMTGAAFDTMDRAIALRAGAANFGRNMPNTAAAYYGNANAAGGMAGNAGAMGMNSAIAAGNFGGQGFNTAVNANNSAGNLALGDYNARLNAYNQEQAQFGSLIGLGVTAATGGIAGGWGGAANALVGRKIFADGGRVHDDDGHVRGPGGPVDDKIPAMLSNGEYVVPADVVKAKGVEFFDKLKAKYHTPAAVQRRRAIERA